MNFGITDYSAMVASLAKPGEAIQKGMTPEKCNLLHMTIGISGEAGELLDAVKKHTVYGKPLDEANVIEELGDLEFYLEGLRQAIGVSRDTVLQHNIAKLTTGPKARYRSGTYSDAQAIARADKA